MISDDYLNFMTHEGHGVSTTYWRNIIFTGKTGFKTFSSLCQTIIWNEHKGRLNKKVDTLIYNVIIRSSALETTSPLVLNKCGGWAECLEWIPSIWRHTAHLNLTIFIAFPQVDKFIKSYKTSRIHWDWWSTRKISYWTWKCLAHNQNFTNIVTEFN